MHASIQFIAPGLSTTVQDLGRPGYSRYGVPTGGAIDPVGLRAANILVGNASDCGALEIAYVGPSFVVNANSARIAFFGASAQIEILNEELSCEPIRMRTGQSALLHRGQVVKVGSLSGSAVMYMAIEGGFAIDPVLGSISTYARGALGGFEGRRLQAGDRLPLRLHEADERPEITMELPEDWRRTKFRVVDGAQTDYFSPEVFDRFCISEYSIGAGSDRMGMRLDGPALTHLRGFNIVSDGIVPGSIQVPGDGLPIVLLRDHQTTGGYPKIATVISADLAALGRAPIGSTIMFERVSMEAASIAFSEMASDIEQLPNKVRQVELQAGAIEFRLGSCNLISGVSFAH